MMAELVDNVEYEFKIPCKARWNVAGFRTEVCLSENQQQHHYNASSC